MILREWFAKKASGAAFCLGYIWILLDSKNRGWHDKIVDTYVVDLNESEKLAVKSQSAQSTPSEQRPVRTVSDPVVKAVQTETAVETEGEIPVQFSTTEAVAARTEMLTEEPVAEIDSSIPDVSKLDEFTVGEGNDAVTIIDDEPETFGTEE